MSNLDMAAFYSIFCNSLPTFSNPSLQYEPEDIAWWLRHVNASRWARKDRYLIAMRMLISIDMEVRESFAFPSHLLMARISNGFRATNSAPGTAVIHLASFGGKRFCSTAKKRPGNMSLRGWTCFGMSYANLSLGFESRKVP